MNDLTPEAVVASAFAAFRRRDGIALAALVAPESLEAYRHAVHSDLQARSPGLTAEDMLQDPDMPPEAKLDGQELLRRSIRSVPDEAIALGHVVVLGHIRADNEAYVLFWLGTNVDGPVRFGHPEIASLKLTDHGWRLLLDQYSPAGMPGFMDKGFVGPSVGIEPWDSSAEGA